MPAAAPFIGIGAVLGGTALSAAGYTALGAILAIGGGIAASTLAAKSGDDYVDSNAHQLNTRSSRQPLPLAYGVCRLGVNQTFLHVENPYLHIICELCEGDIYGIEREDGTVYTTTDNNFPDNNPPLVYLDGKLYTEYDNKVRLQLFTGSSSQNVCSDLESETSKWDQTLRHTAYLYVRLKYDRDVFRSEPEITAVIHGLKIYNPITATTAYTNNPALCAYDYITRSSQRGGIGVAADRIDLSSLSTCIDYCDDKGWTCNMPIGTNRAVADNLRQIYQNFRGDNIFSDGTIKMRFRDLNYESIAMSLDESDIVEIGGNSSLSIVQPDAMMRPNALRASHLSSEKEYRADDIIKTDAAAVTAEGDYREQKVEMYGLSNPELVQKMSNYYLERLRWNKTIALTAGSKAMALEPMDIVQLEHTMPGWSDKMLRVISGVVNDDHTVSLSLLEEKTELYDDVYNLTAHDWDDSELPSPLDTVYSVINVTRTEVVYYYRNRSFTRWEVDFDPPAVADYPFWDYAEIWLKIGSGEWRYMTRCESNYVVDPVEEGETYSMKIRSVSVFGSKEDFDSCTTVEDSIIGATTGPDDLSSITAIANGDSVTIYGTPLSDPDIEGYEIRLGSSWTGGIFISFNKSISLRLNGVRPGTHTFWAAAKDNAGLYSANPVSATVTVFIPPGFSELATYGSWSWDFTSGTHSNTEHDTYSSEDAVKCSHTGSVLTGTWYSPDYDLNAVEKVRIWGDMRVAFESSDTTWAGVIPLSNTWTSINITNNTWQQIFEPSEGAQLRVTLRHKEATEDPWTEIEYFEILCAEIEARYLNVVVTIVDPTQDSNLYLLELNMLAHEGPQ